MVVVLLLDFLKRYGVSNKAVRILNSILGHSAKRNLSDACFIRSKGDIFLMADMVLDAFNVSCSYSGEILLGLRSKKWFFNETYEAQLFEFFEGFFLFRVCIYYLDDIDRYFVVRVLVAKFTKNNLVSSISLKKATSADIFS